MGSEPQNIGPLTGQACYPYERLPAESLPMGEVSICDRPAGADAFYDDPESLDRDLGLLCAMPLLARLECVSRRFIGLPYADDPLGEGLRGDVDRDPTYRFDAADCMTFVEETMAIALSCSYEEFVGMIDSIRYYDGDLIYANRKHFVSADWIPDNTAKGFVADVTLAVGGDFTEQVSITIDRGRWIEAKQDVSDDGLFQIRDDLIDAGRTDPQQVSMDGIPIGAFFVTDGQTRYAREEIFKKLPEISIAVFLKYQNQARKVGVIVSHMGLLIVPREADGSLGTPTLRHSSKGVGGVVEEPFLDFIETQRQYGVSVAILSIGS